MIRIEAFQIFEEDIRRYLSGFSVVLLIEVVNELCDGIGIYFVCQHLLFPGAADE